MTARATHTFALRFDWKGLCLSLRRAGADLAALSLELGQRADWLDALANGRIAEPSWSAGTQLLNYAYATLGPVEVARHGPVTTRVRA